MRIILFKLSLSLNLLLSQSLLFKKSTLVSAKPTTKISFLINKKSNPKGKFLFSSSAVTGFGFAFSLLWCFSKKFPLWANFFFFFIILETHGPFRFWFFVLRFQETTWRPYYTVFLLFHYTSFALFFRYCTIFYIHIYVWMCVVFVKAAFFCKRLNKTKRQFYILF